jgi:CDP-glycerol glycerophosphotransferase (TagB/SpsB family)
LATADLIVASRHYHIQDKLDQIQGHKILWVNYGATLKSPTNLPLIKTEDAHSYDARSKIWRIVSPSPNYKTVLDKFGLDTSNIIFLGYPKMDLIRCSYGTRLEDFGLNPKSKTILYTPTIGWQTTTCQSTFFDYTNYLIYLSLEYGFNLIVRPHPHLLRSFPDIESKLSNIGKLTNVHIDRDYNYYGTFKLADFLISDISSLAYEFLVTTKPVILTATTLTTDLLFEDYVNNKVIYNARNKYELSNEIKSLLGHFDEFKNSRIAFVNSIPKQPTKLIVDYIKREFKK